MPEILNIDNLEVTVADNIRIEEKYSGYFRYVDINTGYRWEVHGICDKRAYCCIGILTEDMGILDTLEKAQKAALAYKGLDNPVRPGFHGCCPFTFIVLESGVIDGNKIILS